MDIAIALKTDAENPVVGDLLLENGTARINKTFEEEVMQDIRNALLLFKGEWFLDKRQGIPYWQSILGMRAPLSLVDQIFKNAIRSRPGVAEVLSYKSERKAKRALELSFTVRLTNGRTISSASYAPLIVGG